MLFTALMVLAAANGPSAADTARTARLMPLVGKWTCSDTGSSKPYPASVKVEGSWIVWRDTGEDANTLYIRWSPSNKRYVVANLTDEGDVEVSTTTGADPLNATWHVGYPQTTGPTFTVHYANGTFSLVRPFVDRKGKRVVARLLCEKN